MRLGPFRLMVLCALFALPCLARADDGGEDAGDGGDDSLYDASIPDASVGQGGADHDNQEGEDGTGRVPTTCRQTSDCERGFSCNAQGRCVYVGVRRADSGCLLGAASFPALFVAALALEGARRKRS